MIHIPRVVQVPPIITFELTRWLSFRYCRRKIGISMLWWRMFELKVIWGKIILLDFLGIYLRSWFNAHGFIGRLNYSNFHPNAVLFSSASNFWRENNRKWRQRKTFPSPHVYRSSFYQRDVFTTTKHVYLPAILSPPIHQKKSAFLLQSTGKTRKVFSSFLCEEFSFHFSSLVSFFTDRILLFSPWAEPCWTFFPPNSSIVYFALFFLQLFHGENSKCNELIRQIKVIWKFSDRDLKR